MENLQKQTLDQLGIILTLAGFLVSKYDKQNVGFGNRNILENKTRDRYLSENE